MLRLVHFKGIHEGKSFVVMGKGPSLWTEYSFCPLNKDIRDILRDEDIVKIGVNDIESKLCSCGYHRYQKGPISDWADRIFPVIGRGLNYLIITNLLYLSNVQYILNSTAFHTFVLATSNIMGSSPVASFMSLFEKVFRTNDKDKAVLYSPRNCGGTERVSGLEIDYSLTTAYPAVLLAEHMGAKKIGLLGIDLTWDGVAKDTIRMINDHFLGLKKALGARGVSLYDLNTSCESNLEGIEKKTILSFLSQEAKG